MVGKTPRAAMRGVPQGYIGLFEAFGLFYQAVTPDWQELDAGVSEAKPSEHGADVPRRDNDVKDGALELALDATDTARRVADKKFRDALANGELRAMYRDPVHGTILQSSPEEWAREKASTFLGGFDDDFVEPGDVLQPGPDTTIRGFLQPVFFDRQEFELWLWPSRDGDSGCYPLPETEPRGDKPKQAYRALKLKYPDGRVPKRSFESLVRVLNPTLKTMGCEPTNREAILRALGIRK